MKERKNLEKRIEDLERQLNIENEMLLNSPNLLFATDKEGKIIEIYGPREELHLPYEELINRNITNILPEEVSEKIKTKLKNNYEDIKTCDFELKFNGEIKNYNLRTKKSDNGLYIHSVVDKTIEKNAQKTILQNERLGAIGELASGIAHDFNNSLQSILGSLELTLMEDISEDAKEYLETAKKSIIDASSRIKQLQKFSRRDKDNNSFKPISLNEIVDDVLLETKYLWKDKAQEEGKRYVITKNYGQETSIFGNSGNLRSSIYNILKNSLQAMPNGGNICLETRKEQEKVFLDISDTGKGMNYEIQKKIFQPFFTTKGFEQGKGLGLSGTYSTIKEHNGNIYVKNSIPEKGTTIEIELPYYDSSEYKEEQNNFSCVNTPIRALWVDDEKIIRTTGKKMINHFGHDVDTAKNGEEALEYIAKNQYDLMITDIGMPSMNGWELIDSINKRFQNRNMKIAVVTGWNYDNISENNKYRNIKFIEKPIQKKELEELIQYVINNK